MRLTTRATDFDKIILPLKYPIPRATVSNKIAALSAFPTKGINKLIKGRPSILVLLVSKSSPSVSKDEPIANQMAPEIKIIVECLNLSM